MNLSRSPLKALVVTASLAWAMCGQPTTVHAKTKQAAKSKSAPKPTKRAKGKKSKTAKSSSITYNFAPGTPLAVVREAFRCVLEYEGSKAFDCYAELNVEANRSGAQALTHLRNYQWTHFRKNAASYVAKGSRFGLTITRTVRGKGAQAHRRIKYFLRSRHRAFPAPVTLSREGNRWFIYQNSL